jgi:RibD domain-containing protein
MVSFTLPTDRKREAAAQEAPGAAPSSRSTAARLAQTLMRHNLIDVYELLVFPVVLGEGKRLFETGIDHSMRLADSRATDSGLVVLTYEPAGELTFSSVEEPLNS